MEITSELQSMQRKIDSRFKELIQYQAGQIQIQKQILQSLHELNKFLREEKDER